MRIAGMPDYDADTLSRLAAQDAKIAQVFARHNYARIEPPIVEPADVFLEQSGEDTRRHLYVFDDAAGAELCLRPDLTIPACRMYLRSKPKTRTARLSYNGPAFRYDASNGQPNQYLQAGVECLGVTDAARSDAEVLALTLQAIEAAGLRRYRVQIGDLGLFFGLIDKLDLPQRWREQLKHQFWRPDYFRTLLLRLSKGSPQKRNALLSSVKGLNAKQAETAVTEILRNAGIPQTGGRSVSEITGRLMQQAWDAQTGGLSKQTVAVLDGFFKINGAPDVAVKQIRALAKSARVSLDDELAVFERRLELLRAQNIDTAAFRYAGQFGRTLEYYTGFVFDVTTARKSGALQIAGGGRYDRLLKRLGAARDIPAVGSAIRTEWLLAASRSRL